MRGTGQTGRRRQTRECFEQRTVKWLGGLKERIEVLVDHHGFMCESDVTEPTTDCEFL